MMDAFFSPDCFTILLIYMHKWSCLVANWDDQLPTKLSSISFELILKLFLGWLLLAG